MKMLIFIKKKVRKHTDAAQPPTLAVFLPWGSSEGADRVALTGAKIQSFY